MRILPWILILCAGTARVATEELECKFCEPNTYCFVDVKNTCPPFSSSPAGSDTVSDCQCHAGFYRFGDLCHLCEEDHYCTGEQAQVRVACPPNTQSFSGAVAASMCVCNSGYGVSACEEPPCACSGCVGGLVKGEPGNQACTPCAEDQYSLTAETCGLCPALMESPAGSARSADCIAVRGAYAEHGQSARLCPKATYQDEVNQTECKLCPRTSFQDAPGATQIESCTSCPENSGIVQSGPGEDVTDCLCSPGHVGPDGGPCPACEAGKFKPASGSSECQACPVDSYAGAGAGECAACPSNSSGLEGGVSVHDCSCHAGHEWRWDLTCVQCAPGSAKAAAGNASCVPCGAGFFATRSGTALCAPCPEDSFSGVGSSQCQTCAAHEFSAAGSGSASDCRCSAGFFRPAGFGEGSACTECPFGTFRNQTHAEDWNSLACLACPTGSSTAATGAVSSLLCEVCPENHFVASEGEREGECVPCGQHSHSLPGAVGGCRCNPGFTLANGEVLWGASCVACASGFYKPAEGNFECTACVPGKHGAETERIEEALSCAKCPVDTHWALAETGAFCEPCPLHSQSVPGSVSASSCICDAGYELSLNECKPCAAGTHKASPSNALTCAPCDGRFFSAYPAATACVSCAANAAGGSLNDADLKCHCDPGFSGPNGGPCMACDVGKFKEESGEHPCSGCGPSAFWPLVALADVNHCEPCPGHSRRSDDAPDSHGVLDCVCDAGYRRTDDSTCGQCPVSFYCEVQHAQEPCPRHSEADAGSWKLQQCHCSEGFFGESGNCSTCPVDAFCPARALSPVICPSNSSTSGQTNSTSLVECVCNAGFYRAGDSVSASCRVCERDSFCFDDQQLACPTNSTAPPGAASVLDCMCDPGFQQKLSGEAGAECIPCHAQQICRDGVVTMCASGASNLNFRCVCDPGSSCSDNARSCTLNESCSACPHDHWCADNGQTPCGENEFALANSSTRSQCRCHDGFYRDHLGGCTECPLHHVCRNETLRPVAEFDPGLRTLATRTVDLSQAVCAEGMFRTAKTDLCKICPLSFYCLPEGALPLPNVVKCPENEFTYETGATSRAECFCLAGFKLTTMETTAKCLPCDVGQRCQGGEVLEEECHVQNKVINADHSKCECDVGFGFVNFDCQACPAGYVKPLQGDEPCGPCNIGEYAMNSTTCVACPQHGNARPASVRCTCAAPYVWSAERTCVLCDEDMYWAKNVADAAGSCTSCPQASTSMAAPSMALGPDACRCAPGHHSAPRNASGRLACQSCAAGHYEIGGMCTACPAGAWAPPQSSSIHDCVCNSQYNTTCHALRVDRSCAGECANTPDECVVCEPGHHKAAWSTPGNAERCTVCAEGAYQPAEGATHCTDCPLHEWHMSLGASDRDACLCVAGFTRPGNMSMCAPCLAGQYKDWLGEEACAPCAVGRYQPHVNATICHFCSAATANSETLRMAVAEEVTAGVAAVSNISRLVLDSRTTVLQAAVSVLACVCEAGHEPRGTGSEALTCQLCVPGSFKAPKNHELCTYCGVPSQEYGHALLHHFGAPGAGATDHSHCQACPAFSGQDVEVIGPGLRVMANFSDCKCFPGHEDRSTQGCNPCPPYRQQTKFSEDACVYCAPGFFFVDRHLSCESCALADDGGGAAHVALVLNKNDFSLSWGTSFDDCVCRLGYEREVSTDLCAACPTGSFRGSNRTRACAQCPVDTYQNSTAQVTCRPCPSNSSTLRENGRVSIEHCVCGPGFKPLSQDLCSPCDAGTFRSHRWVNESAQACEACPLDHFCPLGAIQPIPCPRGEVAIQGSRNIDGCQCVQGRGRAAGPAHAPEAPESNPCRVCDRGFFAPSPSNSECTACPLHKNTSDDAATSPTDCTCVAGHGIQTDQGHDLPCLACSDGFFSAGGVNAPCIHCGWGAITDPTNGATSEIHCQCNALAGLRNTDTAK